MRLRAFVERILHAQGSEVNFFLVPNLLAQFRRFCHVEQ